MRLIIPAVTAMLGCSTLRLALGLTKGIARNLSNDYKLERFAANLFNPRKATMRTISDTFRPKNQADCDVANTLREYEAAHKVWMNTSIFTEAGIEAKLMLDATRKAYTEAVERAHPTWIVM